MTQDVDVVIVGSGASGAAAAWRLSKEKNLRIVCLEQGAFNEPSEFPTTRSDWEVSKFAEYSFNPKMRHSQFDYPIDSSESPISIANFNGFGGSTVLYSGHFPRMHPSDFLVHTLDGVGQDWPIKYEDLLQHFELNESIMGVAGLAGDPANDSYINLLPPVPLGRMGMALAEGFNKLGWHWWPSYAAINTARNSMRGACINLGPCNTGCAQGAKGSVDQTYWPLARRQGVHVLTECQAIEVTVDTKGKAKGILYISKSGDLHELRARIVVLACNGIGTPRLLLNSISTAYPEGIGNESGLVGKNLMLHPLAYVEGVFEEDLQSSIGPQGVCMLSQQFYESDLERGFVRGYSMQVLRGAPPLETATLGYLMRRIPIGPNHHMKFSEYFNKSAGIAIITEDLPEMHNRVTLDYVNKDKHGMPGVRIHYTLSDNTKKMLKHGIDSARQVFGSSGARVVSSFAPVSNSGWHLMGTARMGSNPATSVVNRYGQVHGVSNLFIVDSSIFVTAGAVNPVATAQALTLWICEFITKHYKGL